MCICIRVCVYICVHNTDKPKSTGISELDENLTIESSQNLMHGHFIVHRGGGEMSPVPLPEFSTAG